MMQLLLDNARGRTRIEKICDAVHSAIISGRWHAGMRIPSIRRLAEELGMSPFTVAEAYDRLVAQGLLQARRGTGFYVVGPRTLPCTGTPPVPLQALPVDDDWLLRNVYEHTDDTLQAGCGWLPPTWYDSEALQRALRQLARRQNLQQGYGEPRGFAGLVQWVGAHLREQDIPAQAGRIVLTQGASKALDMVAGSLLRPGDTVLVDDPGYSNLLSGLVYRGINIVGVPWLPTGPDCEAVARLAEEHSPKAFFTNPRLHNPTGASYALPTLHRVLEVARRHDFLLVEDNVSSDLYLGREPTLAAMDGLERVIHIGSFSKTLSPGLRVGYLAAPPGLADRLIHYKMLSGLTSPELNERLVLEMLQEGRYRRQVDRLCQRLAAAQAAAGQRFDALGWERFGQPTSGLFFWARPRQPLDTVALAEAARHERILLAPGHLFRPHGEATPWLRFNVACAMHPALTDFLTRQAACAE